MFEKFTADPTGEAVPEEITPAENEPAGAAESERDPGFEKEIARCKDNVAIFMQGLGIEDGAQYLPADEDILLGGEGNDSESTLRISKDLPPQSRTIYEKLGMEEQLEELGKDSRMRELTFKLIRFACDKAIAEKQSEGDAPQRAGFAAYERALTEITMHQLFRKEGADPDHISNPYLTIFLSVLVEDMTKRLNGGDPLATSNPRLPDTIKDKVRMRMETRFDDPKREELRFSETDILALLQKGLFESDRSCLEMIGAVYGEKALEALSRMGDDLEDVIDTARAFQPQYNSADIGNRTATGINHFMSNLPTRIKLADEECHISIVNLL